MILELPSLINVPSLFKKKKGRRRRSRDRVVWISFIERVGTVGRNKSDRK